MAKKNMESVASDGSRAISKFHVSEVIIILVLVILCSTCVLPFWHLLVKSISSDMAVMMKEVFFWPKEFTLNAYSKVFADKAMVRSMLYSVVATLIFTFLGMIACTCAAYPLSKNRLKGKKFFTFVLMVPMYFTAGMIPAFILMYNLKLIDNMWVLILPLIYSPYNMLVMKTYFQSTIPDSLEESAYLDGATNFQVLRKIVLPLSKPIIATLSLFYAVGRWNSYADHMYFIRSDSKRMIQYKLYLLVQGAEASISATLGDTGGASNVTTPEVLQAACIMFVSVPIIVIYPFLQKYFVKGVMVGAVKG